MTPREDWPVVDGAERIAWSRYRVEAAREEITTWLAERRADQRFGRFGVHFDILEALLVGRMLTAVTTALEEVPADGPPGAAHERCRAIEASLDVVRRTHWWYAEKYDQRRDDRLGETLRAADEVVRSCWTEPFTVLGKPPPSGPLVYLEPRFGATATPRLSVPPDLRAPGDSVIADCVKEMPVPVVVLPAMSVLEPWWLVLGAHETGHQVQFDLELVEPARAALGAATGELGDLWQQWAWEAFADAFSVLMVGSGAAWAIEELQYGDANRLVHVPRGGDRYPPPAVRTALLGELALGCGLPGVSAEQVCERLPADVPAVARSAVVSHLEVTAKAARALLELRVEGTALPELCGFRAGLFGPGGAADGWTRALATENPKLSGQSARVAARLGIAGAVEAFRTRQTVRNLLRANVTSELARCGPPGFLAAPPQADLGTIGDRLVARVLGREED